MNRKPVALVSGASSGIGLATAQQLSDAGYIVYGTSRRKVTPEPKSFNMIVLDVNSEESVSHAVNELLTREGHIDLLVNNAGYGLEPSAAEESSLAQALALFDTNVMGVIRMTRAVLPHMRQQKKGRIINIGSILGLVPMPYVALYAATKHAIEGYSEALDHEVRTLGIRISVIEPAYTRTQFESNNVPADSSLPDYTKVLQKIRVLVNEAMKTADEPIIVAQVILKAAQDEKPRIRYTAGKAARILSAMRRFMPAAFVDTAIRKNLGL